MKKLILLFSLSMGIIAACTKNECKENPKKDCMCTEQYDPVCGCNNKTYGNACEAECNSITKYTKGECK